MKSHCYTMKIRGGVEVDSTGKKAGKGPLIQKELSATLGTNQDQYIFQPLVCIKTYSKSRRAQSKTDFETWKESKVSNTLNTFDQGDIRATDIVVCLFENKCHGIAYGVMRSLGGITALENKCPTLQAANGTSGNNKPIVILDRAAYNQGANAQYDFHAEVGEVSPTVIAKGPGAVCFPTEYHGVCYPNKTGPLMANSHPGSYSGQDAYNDMFIVEKTMEYIVRRLTPLECCRLQGFPDGWAEIDHKEDFTEEEYLFWLDVRNAYADINGRQTKEYTKEQMLTWYNKLHTDSAEYKMWGNGIALPNAYFVLSRIAEELKKEEGEK